MSKIAGILLLSLLVAGCHKPSNPSVFQVRLVVTNSSTDSEKMFATYNSSVETFQVQITPLLNAAAIESAHVIYDVPQKPWIGITFTEAGAKQFAEITRQHIGDRLAIIVDGKLLSAPIIQAEIPDGKADIAGNFTKTEAKALASKINDAVAK